MPNVRVSPSLAGELQSFTYDQGSVELFGRCFADQSTIRSTGALALSGDSQPLDDLSGVYSTIQSTACETRITPDVSGQFPVFWRQDGGSTLLSASASELGSVLNPLYLAATIVRSGIAELQGSQSAYADVHRISPGQQLRVAMDQKPQLETREHVPTEPDIAAVLFKQALSNAVRCRMSLRKQVTADFSGGKDSTSIALLAAAMTQQPFDVFFQHSPNLATGDWQAVNAVLPDAPDNLHLHTVPIEESGYEYLVDADLFDEPGIAANAGKIGRWFQMLRNAGSELHLTGDGGDALLYVPSSSHLFDLAREKKFEQLEKDSFIIARMRHRDPRHLMQFVISHADRTLGQDLQTFAKVLRDPEQLATADRMIWLHHPGYQTISLLQNGIRQQLADRAEEATATVKNSESNMADHVAWSAIRQGGSVFRQLRQAAKLEGVEIDAPFLDPTVVRTALARPTTERGDPRRFKPLLEDAFHGTLPESLLSRTTKGDYSNVSYRRLRASGNTIGELLTNSRLSDLGIIKPTRVVEYVHRLDMGLQGDFSVIDAIVAAESWLRAKE